MCCCGGQAIHSNNAHDLRTYLTESAYLSFRDEYVTHHTLFIYFQVHISCFMRYALFVFFCAASARVYVGVCVRVCVRACVRACVVGVAGVVVATGRASAGPRYLEVA